MTYKHKSHETLWLSSLLIWIILCCTFEPRPEQDALNMMQGVSEREILRQVLGKKEKTFVYILFRLLDSYRHISIPHCPSELLLSQGHKYE